MLEQEFFLLAQLFLLLLVCAVGLLVLDPLRRQIVLDVLHFKSSFKLGLLHPLRLFFVALVIAEADGFLGLGGEKCGDLFHEVCDFRYWLRLLFEIAQKNEGL